MKSRRNTSESESEPSGNKLRASRATQDSGLSGVSVEMSAWTRRNGSSNGINNTVGVFPQSKTPDTVAPPNRPLPLPPAAYQRPSGGYSSAPQSPRHFGQPFPQQQRASSSSSQYNDGRNSRRGSRGNSTPRPTPIPAVGVDGEELYFPLSPAPTKHNRKSDAGTRLTHGSESEVLPPDDRNYPVPPFNPALFQLPPQQEPLPQLQPFRGHGQEHNDPNQPTSSHLRIIHASATGPPSIYWSDDGASAGGGAETATIATSTNPSAFTFYRETTPPPGNRRHMGAGNDDVDDIDDDDDDDDEDNTIENEKRTRRPSQFREIGIAVASPKRRSKRKGSTSAFRDLTGGRSGDGTTGGAVGSGGGGGGGGGGGSGRRPGEASDDDEGARGVHLEDQDAEQEFFVNGRYVPPALREGRKPGRKPVSEDADARSEDSYYNGDRGGRRFWMIAGGVMFFIIAVAVGVGVGVGITLSHKNDRPASKYTPIVNNNTATATTTTAAATLASAVAAAHSVTSPPTTATTTSTSSAATSTATSLTDCPAANGTTYTVPGSSTNFLRLCGIDYSGTGAAVDLSHLPTTSMDDCMNNCAGTSGCTACGWGPPNSSTTSTDSTGFVVSGKNYQCYLKSTLGSAKKAVSADSDWCFAILQ
ncbi:hypothetical protein SBRCBS47491_007789 [Sporothrix bragantina]|uniref:Apple domain-containing protein n=1 Tax=Sporothrix bragantina TaxID=671064 RepID=A0ABP0CHB5_9PEZI